MTAGALMLMSLWACGGSDGAAGAAGANGANALVATSTEPAGSYCANGGTRIASGPDTNGNGVLDSAEVTGTQFVCNGSAGAVGSNGLSALFATANEPAGAHCASGGTKVTAGVDTDTNGVLATAEVTSTAYVCNGATGAAGATGSTGAAGHASLIAMATEAAGSHCTYGGIVITSGVDANDNGVLAVGEVGATSYVCNGSGVNWNNVTSATAVQMASNAGYIANSVSGSATLTLPITPSIGDIVRVKGSAAPGWTLAQNAGQSVDLSGLSPLSARAGESWSLVKNTGIGWETSVATTADGNTVIAVPRWNDSVFISTDAGANWAAPITLPEPNLFDVHVAPDGSAFYVRGPSGLFVSTNGGANWTLRTAMSTVDVVAAFNGGVVALGTVGGIAGPYLSTDFGATWTALVVPTVPSSPCWASIAVSPNGQHVAIGADGNGGCSAMPTWITHDQGATWISTPSVGGPPQNRNQLVSVSSSGNTIVIVSRNGGIGVYVSNDGGSTWVDSGTLSGLSVQANSEAVVSADGRRIVVPTNDAVYVSSNAGYSWRAAALPTEGAFAWLAGDSTLSTIYGGTVRGNGGLVLKSKSTLSLTSTTTTGTGGAVSGGASDALELQYLGGGRWGLLSGIGNGLIVR